MSLFIPIDYLKVLELEELRDDDVRYWSYQQLLTVFSTSGTKQSIDFYHCL